MNKLKRNLQVSALLVAIAVAGVAERPSIVLKPVFASTIAGATATRGTRATGDSRSTMATRAIAGITRHGQSR